jgi:hypothetical protein
MSGGERRKRTSRGQGWEEAGAEFYQESYPADVDLEVLQRDPAHIATLLPSKQSRAGMKERVVWCMIVFSITTFLCFLNAGRMIISKFSYLPSDLKVTGHGGP